MNHLRTEQGAQNCEDKAMQIGSDRRCCPVCQQDLATRFFLLEKTPVDCGTLSKNADDAMAALKSDIELFGCPLCGFVFNGKFDPSLISFGQSYEVSLNHSPVFSEFQQDTANRIASRFELEGKNITEIGCGNGEFLQLLCETANCNGVGVDPTAKTDRSRLKNGRELEFHRDLFDASYKNPLGDFVCSLSMFETVPDPNAFLSNLQWKLQSGKTPIYFEVFNGERALKENEIWSLHYEQCNYFGESSLVSCFEKTGFTVLDSGSCYGDGQYLFVEALSADQRESSVATHSTSENKCLAVKDWWEAFESQYRTRKSYWENRLADLNEGEVFLWGSGGKSINFLNSIGNSSRIGGVIDNNSKRQGKFIPGTAHRVAGPDFLHQVTPGLMIVSNAIYREEIANQIAEMGLEIPIEIA